MRRLAVLLVLLAGIAEAGPEVSKRPALRPGTAPVVEIAPDRYVEQPERGSETKAETNRGTGFLLRPFLRSRKAERAARQQKRTRQKGAVCGDVAIQGEPIGRVRGKLKGCGLDNAVRVRSVSGVTLSQSSVMDCRTAKALKSWIDGTAKPSLRRKGGGVSQIKVAAHYACRRRNNARSGKISEHGKGRAIDISAFRLQNGTEITVLKGWNSRKHRKALRAMHRGACGPFGTVLGPKANRFHLDHFHFDTARYRSGSYCR